MPFKTVEPPSPTHRNPEDEALIRRAIRAGANRVMLEPVEKQVLIQGVTRVIDEARCLQPDIPASGDHPGREACKANSKVRRLSIREQQAIKCLSDDQSEKEIADRLGIAPSSVHTLLRRAVHKLGAKTRRDAIRKFQLLCRQPHP